MNVVYCSRFSKYVCFLYISAFVLVYGVKFVLLRGFGGSKLKACSDKGVYVFDAVVFCDFCDCVGMDD